MKKAISTIGIGMFMFAFHYIPNTEKDMNSTLLKLNPWASPAAVRKCDDSAWQWYTNSYARPSAELQRATFCSNVRRTSTLHFSPISIKSRL